MKGFVSGLPSADATPTPHPTLVMYAHVTWCRVADGEALIGMADGKVIRVVDGAKEIAQKLAQFAGLRGAEGTQAPTTADGEGAGA